MDGFVTEADMRCFFAHTIGSMYGPKDLFHPLGSGKCDTDDGITCRHWEAVSGSPNVWIGEVSWMKAALVPGEGEEFIPGRSPRSRRCSTDPRSIG